MGAQFQNSPGRFSSSPIILFDFRKVVRMMSGSGAPGAKAFSFLQRVKFYEWSFALGAWYVGQPIRCGSLKCMSIKRDKANGPLFLCKWWDIGLWRKIFLMSSVCAKQRHGQKLYLLGDSAWLLQFARLIVANTRAGSKATFLCHSHGNKPRGEHNESF